MCGAVKCDEGYAVIATGGVCANVNECAAGTAVCDANAACRDSDPSQGAEYSCVCNPGFSGDGKTCTAVTTTATVIGTTDTSTTSTSATTSTTSGCEGGSCSTGGSSSGSISTGAIVAAPIAVIVLALVVVLLRRRRRGSAPKRHQGVVLQNPGYECPVDGQAGTALDGSMELMKVAPEEDAAGWDGVAVERATDPGYLVPDPLQPAAYDEGRSARHYAVAVGDDAPAYAEAVYEHRTKFLEAEGAYADPAAIPDLDA